MKRIPIVGVLVAVVTGCKESPVIVEPPAVEYVTYAGRTPPVTLSITVAVDGEFVSGTGRISFDGQFTEAPVEVEGYLIDSDALMVLTGDRMRYVFRGYRIDDFWYWGELKGEFPGTIFLVRNMGLYKEKKP